ncbi:MAG: hypothetical protein JO190_01580 [Candidatus Eremiobacteraeota bacterium]|nr:hypothetical protein [Candidatus Eremiobacteraeota bacterium]MBV8499350.1 hypothetical protein [Candidatus Eremiobacteraeota bacterium]
MEIKPTYLGTMIALATVAFGLLAAGAWNKFIADLIAVFLKPGNGIWAELLYAVVVTLIAIVVIQSLAKLAEREAALAARLPFGKKPQE